MSSEFKEKIIFIEKLIVWIIGTLAMCLATRATSMCLLWGFYEPKMPKSLYEIEK